MIPYADDEVGICCGAVLGLESGWTDRFSSVPTGDVRGVYAVTRAARPASASRLIVASLATEVYVAESSGSGGGELFVSRDGAFAAGPRRTASRSRCRAGRSSSPDGPIVWLASAGGV